MLNTIVNKYPIDITNTSTIPTLHVFKVTFIPESDTKPCRVKISSEYWNKSITIGFGGGTEASNTLELALLKISKYGFNIVARSNQKDYFLIMSDTFKSELTNPFNN